MKTNSRRAGVAALALVIALSAGPAALAAPGDRPEDVRAKIVRLLKNLQKSLGVTILDDLPSPPKP
jgi:hypothetical protein